MHVVQHILFQEFASHLGKSRMPGTQGKKGARNSRGPGRAGHLVGVNKAGHRIAGLDSLAWRK